MNARQSPTRSRARAARTACAAGAAAALAGFTIVEMLLVVAIIAFLTIGVAQVFRVTGETVKAGRRISNLNAYAAMVEKQVRSDFAALSREGFMVMRHRTAGGTSPTYTDALIYLAPNDTNPRRRRVDELVFFITGDFTSKRDPIYPTRQAKATQARVYYGHGLRKNPNSPTYYGPLLIDDPNNTTDTPGFGVAGANQYASSWTLLRHETLLCQPSTIVEERLPSGLLDPSPVYAGGNPNNAACEDLDSDIQIRLQPAASSIFRYIMSFEPNGMLDPRFSNNFVVRDEPGPLRPMFTSGIVDIATTDLSEIRAIILDAQPFFNRSAGASAFSLNDDNVSGGNPNGDPVNGSFFYRDTNPGAANSITRLMHAWMRQALPANSDAGERMRYEPQPPDFLGVLGSANGAGFTQDYRRTDQAMLAASNFVPGCTEFIVEWSFGKAYPANDPDGRGGQLIWHGLRRDAGVTSTGDPAYAALPYGDILANGQDLYHMPYRRRDGSTAYWPPFEPHPQPVNNVNVVREYSPIFNAGIPEYSYFGYIDPTFRPRSIWTDIDGNGFADTSNEMFEDVNGNNRQDADEPTVSSDIWYDPPSQTNTGSNEKPDPREPSTIPWPWPKLVRITMSLADPNDPLREETFQFIVEVPESINDISN